MKKIILLAFFLAAIAIPAAAQEEPPIPRLIPVNWIFDHQTNTSMITYAIDNPGRVNICSLDTIFRIIDFQVIDYQSHSSGLECHPIGSNQWECFQGLTLFLDGRIFSFTLKGSGSIKFQYAAKNTECDPFDPYITAVGWQLSQAAMPLITK